MFLTILFINLIIILLCMVEDLWDAEVIQAFDGMEVTCFSIEMYHRKTDELDNLLRHFQYLNFFTNILFRDL